MITFPADERRLSEIERGRSSEAIVPMPSDGPLVVGDIVLFALTQSRAGQEPSYVKGGDSVQVSITGITDLGTIDPANGQMLVRLTWVPLGPSATAVAASTPKIRQSRGKA